MRQTLFAVLLGTTLIHCKAEKSLQAMEPPAGNAASPGRAEPDPAKEAAAPGVARDEGGRWSDTKLGAAGAEETSGGAIATTPRTPARPDAAAAPAGVRAGEWDDNANYRDYVKWLQDARPGIARLDVRERQFVVVKDRDGKPVPNCKIEIRGDHATTSLITMASGRALVFPHAHGLGGGALEATARCGQSRASTALTRQLDGVTELMLSTARQLPARRTIDLAFVLDTTGSMGEEIDAVKHTIRAVADKLASDQADVRIGLVAYKDRGDEYVTKVFPFSSNLPQFSRSVAEISASGGGDMPEDMQQGLTDALDKLQWRDDAVARLVVVIADAPPHLDYQDQKDYADSARRAASRGIKLYTVSASGMDSTGQVVMRQMAQFTGASNLFVLRGGAGPQSVGGGDPESSCGGTQQQYASGKLDQLILAKLRYELASIDADPLRIPGVGKDESAKPCDQRIAIASP
jgi:Mg-chelatase subunit ChlD